MGNQNPKMNLRLKDPLTRKQLDRPDLKQDHNRTSLSRNHSNQHDPHQEPLRNNHLKNLTDHPGLNQEVLQKDLTKKHTETQNLIQIHLRTDPIKKLSGLQGRKKDDLMMTLTKRNRTGHPGLNQEVLQKDLTKKHTETQNLIQIHLRTDPIKKLSGLQGRKKDDLMMTLTKRNLSNLPDLNQEALQKDLTKKHTKALIKRNLIVNQDLKQGILPGSHSAKESS